MTTCYLGIDPGLSGAIAIYNPENGDLDVYDMPTHAITVNGKKKNQIDLYQLGNLIDTLKHKVKLAVVERVSSMPGQGVASVFSFGFSAGVAQGVLAANLIPMVLVRYGNGSMASPATRTPPASVRRSCCPNTRSNGR